MEQNKENVRQEIKEAENQKYQQKVKTVTPTPNLFVQMAKAFLVGGIICCIGQAILNYATNRMGIDKETAGAWCSMLLKICIRCQTMER